MHWTTRGLYFQLLEIQWRHGFVPLNNALAAQLLGADAFEHTEGGPDFEQAWEVAVSHFVPHAADPEKLVNPRQAQERWQSIDRLEAQRRGGREGGRASGRARKALAEVAKEPTDGSLPRRLPEGNPQALLDTVTVTTTDTDDTEGSSLRSSPSAAGSSEKWWNERLAPLARSLHPGKVGDWLRWCKANVGIDSEERIEEAERVLEGLRGLIDSGQLRLAGPGDEVSPAVFNFRLRDRETGEIEKDAGHELRVRAESYWYQMTAPQERTSGRKLGRLSV
jgi:hypothetical protein